MDYMKGNGGEHQDNANRFGNEYGFALAEMYNFKIHWILTKSWGFPGGKDNKTFNGCMGILQRNEAELSTACVLYRIPRQPVMTPAFAKVPVRILFLFKHPSHGRGIKGLRSAFLRPMNDSTWIATFSTFILLLFGLILMHHKRDSIVPIFVSIIGIISQQGVVERFSLIQAKFIIIIALLLSFILFQFYSASIVSSLLLPTPKTITTMDKLRETDIPIVLENLSFVIPVFQYHEVARKFYKKKIEGHPEVISASNATEYIRKGFAYFGYIDNIYDRIKLTFQADEIDELQEVPFTQREVEGYTSLPIRKHSPYAEIFKSGALRVWEIGLTAYWSKRWIMERPAGNLQQYKVVEVDLNRVKEVFYILFVGYFCSFILFLAEIVVFQMKKLKNYQLLIFKRTRNSF